MASLASARSIFEQNIQKNKEAGCDKNILGQKSNPSRVVARRLFAHHKLSDDSGGRLSDGSNTSLNNSNNVNLNGSIRDIVDYQRRRSSSISSQSSVSSTAAVLQCQRRPPDSQAQQPKGEITVERRRSQEPKSPDKIILNQPVQVQGSQEKISKAFPFKDALANRRQQYTKKRDSISNLAEHLEKLEMQTLRSGGRNDSSNSSLTMGASYKSLGTSHHSLEMHQNRVQLPDFRQSTYGRRQSNFTNHNNNSARSDSAAETSPVPTRSTIRSPFHTPDQPERPTLPKGCAVKTTSSPRKPPSSPPFGQERSPEKSSSPSSHRSNWIRTSTGLEEDGFGEGSHHGHLKTVPFTKPLIRRHGDGSLINSRRSSVRDLMSNNSLRDSSMHGSKRGCGSRRDTSMNNSSKRDGMNNSSTQERSSRRESMNNSSKRDNNMKKSSHNKQTRKDSMGHSKGSLNHSKGSLSGSSGRQGSTRRGSTSSRSNTNSSSRRRSNPGASSPKPRTNIASPPDAEELALLEEIEAFKKKVQATQATLTLVEESEQSELKKIQERKERKLKRIETQQKKEPTTAPIRQPSNERRQDSVQTKVLARQLKHENVKIHDQNRKMKLECVAIKASNRLLEESIGETKDFILEVKAQKQMCKDEHDHWTRLATTYQNAIRDVTTTIEKKGPSLQRVKKARSLLEERIDIIVAFMQEKCTDFSLVEELTILAFGDEGSAEEYDADEDKANASLIRIPYRKEIESDDESPKSIADLLMPTSSHSLHLFVG